MSSALASNEKIRQWREHFIDMEDLAKQLETKIHNDPPDNKFHGLTSTQALAKYAHWGPN
jgi:hypothetical protein